MSSASAAMLPSTVPRRWIHSGWYRVVVDVLTSAAPRSGTADRFTAMVDGVAMRIRQLPRPLVHLTLRHLRSPLAGKPGT
ncbi:hypothetical protein ACWDG9_30985 [Streptomyces sp. NPDC001073]